MAMQGTPMTDRENVIYQAGLDHGAAAVLEQLATQHTEFIRGLVAEEKKRRTRGDEAVKGLPMSRAGRLGARLARGLIALFNEE